MTNWAANLATGGAATPIPSSASVTTQAGPQVYFNGPKPWNSSFNPQTGLVTYTNSGNPSQQFTESISNPNAQFGNIPGSTIAQWKSDYAQSQSGQNAGGTPGSSGGYPQFLGGSGGATYSGAGQTGGGGSTLTFDYASNINGVSMPTYTDPATGQALAWNPQTQQWGNIWYGKWTPAQAPQNFAAQNPSNAQQQNELGPYLGQAWGAIGQQEQATQQMAPIQAETAALNQFAMNQANQLNTQGQAQIGQGENILGQGGNILSQGEGILGQGQTMLNQATTGSGLFPSQQAMINEAVQSEQTQIATQLGAEGLSKSTQLASLQGEAAIAGAGQAGGLVQGNISAANQTMGVGINQEQVGISQEQAGMSQEQIGQNAISLSQAAQKLALGAQTLSVGEQSALVSEYANIASQSASLQAQTWSQALQGYGMLGSMIQASAQSYGYSLQAYEGILQAETQQAQIQAQMDTAAAQADAQGTSSIFSGLGSLLGGASKGGGGGGSGGGSGASSISGIIGAVVGLISLFCWLAREVYGVDNPKWLEFREWMLTKAPAWLRDFYQEYGQAIARWVQHRPVVKAVLRFFMDQILTYA